MKPAICFCLVCVGSAFAQSIPPSRQAEGARLSNHVYDIPLQGDGTLMGQGQVAGFKAPTGYKVVGALGNDSTGFQGAIYQSESGGKYTVVYRGTNFTDMKDLKADASIKLGGPEFKNQLKDAERLTDHAVKTYGKENVSIAGHSLGGAIATVESARLGLSAEVYNAPGMSDYIQKEHPNARVELVTNHNRASDPVSGNVGTQTGFIRTYPSRYDPGPGVIMPATPYGDPNTSVAIANLVGDHSIEPFSNYINNGGTPIDSPTLRTLDGKSRIVEQWNDAGANTRRKEFEGIAKANADDARSKAAAAQAAATLSAEPPAPDPMMTILSTVLAAQVAGKQAASADAGSAKGTGASCPKKAFSTPDGCHPGHDEKAHPGGCFCG